LGFPGEARICCRLKNIYKPFLKNGEGFFNEINLKRKRI